MNFPSKEVLARFRGPGRCESCGLYAYQRDAHHLWPRGRGNAFQFDVPMNIVSLDRVCHTFAEAAGKTGRAVFVAKVARREGLTAGHVGRQMARLRRMPKECRVCPDCLASCFRPKPSLDLCPRCEGGGILGRHGEPWVEVPRRLAGT